MATSDQQFSCRTSDGRFGRTTNATGSFIGPARITYIQAEGVADSNVKLYDGTDTTGALVFEGNCGAEGLDIYVPGSGIRCKTGIYLDLTNTTSVTIGYTG
jgi:hypothetical protein